MNNVDVFILVASFAFVIFGLRSGALRTLISIVGVYLATFFASGFAPIAISVFSVLSVQENKGGQVIMFLMVFAIISLLIEFFLVVSKSLLSVAVLGPVDGLLGGVLGAIKGLIIAAIICNVVMTAPLSDQTKAAINSSTLRALGDQILKSTYPAAITAVPAVQKYLSDNVGPALNKMSTASGTSEEIVILKEQKGGNAAPMPKLVDLKQPMENTAVKAVADKINTLTKQATQ